MSLHKFYFTYGNDDQQPYRGGWTEVFAPDGHLACMAFRVAHPDRIPNILNCSSVYTEEEFAKTNMVGARGNFGFRCREVIIFNITVHGEEVMENESKEADPAAERSPV